jgi:hypothetical protein
MLASADSSLKTGAMVRVKTWKEFLSKTEVDSESEICGTLVPLRDVK